MKESVTEVNHNSQ